MISKKFKVVITLVLAVGAVGIALGSYAASGGLAQAENTDKDFTTSSTYMMTDASSVNGDSSTLARTKDRISATFQTSDLQEGNAYTMWWVIFNNPEECEHPVPGITSCGEGDVFGKPFGETPVQVSVQYAAGNIVSQTGIISLGADLNVGDLPTQPGQLVFGPGLIDAKKAEIHLVVRDHGPYIPGMVEAQLTTFGGACTAATDPTGIGPVGPNECADVQFAAHVPFQLR